MLSGGGWVDIIQVLAVIDCRLVMFKGKKKKGKNLDVGFVGCSCFEDDICI